jgi:hypothetical protein
MGIDANGYCTQCRTYRGVPQPPQQPTSGTPYSGAPYGGQPYAGYPTSSGPSYSPPPGYSDPVSAPPTTYGGTYGAPPTPPPTRNKYLMPVLALSGVLVILVVAIVVVAALKNNGDTPTNPVAGPATTGPSVAKTSAKAAATIDECLVGTWTTKTYTEQVAMDGVGNVPISLDKNGSVMKFTPDGKLTETYTNSQFSGSPTISGQKVPITITVNANVTATVHTTSGSIVYSDLKSDGKINTKAPSINFDQTDDFETDDNPAKYSCSGDNLTMSTSQINSTATRTSTSY